MNDPIKFPIDLDTIKERLEGVNVDDAWRFWHFMANAPIDVEALVAEVERLRALQRAVNTVLDLVEDEESVNMFAQVFEAQDALLTVARKIR